MNGKQLKNAILQLAIQGKLVPQDANDEPASVLLAQIRKEKEQLLKAGKLKKKDLETTPINDEEKPFEIPESWEWVRLKDILFSLTDGTHSTPHYTTSGIPFLSVKDMSSGTISFDRTKFISEEEHSDLIKRCNPQKGDILLSKVGTTGIPVKIDTDIPFSIFVSLALLKFNSTSIYADFLVYLISSPLVQLQVQENTRGVGNKNWVLNDIANTIIPLPPLAEQHRIIAKIEELMPLVEEFGAAQEKLDRLNGALPEALKKSILQQAIQGKLVPQDANDEPASVLLAKIRKEKEQLVKAGKLKKKDLETTPISDEEKPFEIPEGWEWVRIQEISDSYIGLTYKPTDVAENGKMVLRSSNIQDGKIDLNDKVKVNLSIPEKLIVHENDILICARNGSSKLVGKSALITKEADGMTFGAFMAICKTSFYDFVYQFLQSDLFFSQLREVSGTTTINQLTQKNFNSFIIPLPPLAEQKRIVARVEELMELVEGMK